MSLPCEADPELFFDVRRERQAVTVCMSCPVRARCRGVGRMTRSEYGVFGGETPLERLGWMYLRANTREAQNAIWRTIAMAASERRMVDARRIARATGIPTRVVAARLRPRCRDRARRAVGVGAK